MVYCPKCGEEVQVISAVDDLEDEILRELVDDNNRSEPRENTSAEAAKAKNRTKAKKKKRSLLRIIVILIIVAAAAVITVSVYSRSQTPERLLARAEEKYAGNNFDRAEELLDRLLAKDADNINGLLLAGNVYAEISDYDAAENMFLRVISLDPGSADAYEGLLRIYALQGKRSEILALKETVTDETILAIFDEFVTPEPEIMVDGGTFDDYFTVEIRAPKNDLTVYYTLDGSVPTSSSVKYDSPVEISVQGITTLTAVCMDGDGNYSEPVSVEYLVELLPPDMPVASPDGGEFSAPASVTVTVPEGTTVYYTWDNSTPSLNSNRYTEPIEIPEGNNVLSLIAIDSRGVRSNVLKCNYIYYPETTSQSISSSYSGPLEDTQSIEGIDIVTEEVWDDDETEPVAVPLDEPAEPSEPEETEDTAGEEEPEPVAEPLDEPAEED